MKKNGVFGIKVSEIVYKNKNKISILSQKDKKCDKNDEKETEGCSSQVDEKCCSHYDEESSQFDKKCCSQLDKKCCSQSDKKCSQDDEICNLLNNVKYSEAARVDDVNVKVDSNENSITESEILLSSQPLGA